MNSYSTLPYFNGITFELRGLTYFKSNECLTYDYVDRNLNEIKTRASFDDFIYPDVFNEYDRRLNIDSFPLEYDTFEASPMKFMTNKYDRFYRGFTISDGYSDNNRVTIVKKFNLKYIINGWFDIDNTKETLKQFVKSFKIDNFDLSKLYLHVNDFKSIGACMTGINEVRENLRDLIYNDSIRADILLEWYNSPYIKAVIRKKIQEILRD